MDKNFVNVDDLARQKLGGREEREPSGAWLNMRELLDKEMPQAAPVGMLLWRRVFSSMAVLLVVGAAGVGAYKLASSPDVAANNIANAGNAAVAATAADKATQNNTAAKQLAASGLSGSAVSSTATNLVPGNNSTGNNGPVTGETQNMPNATTVGHVVANEPVGANTGSQHVNDSRLAMTTNNNSGAPVNGTRSNVGSSSVSNVPATNNGNSSNRNLAGTSTVAANRNTVPGSSIATAPGAVHNANSRYANNVPATNQNTHNDALTGVPVHNTNVRSAANTYNGVNGTTLATVTANNPAKNNTNKIGAKTAANNNRHIVPTTGNTLASGNMTRTKGPNGVKSNKVITAQSVKANGHINGPSFGTAADQQKLATGYKENYTPGVPVFVTQSGKSIPGDKLQKLNRVKAKIPITEIDPSAVTQKGKKTIQKMSLVEHFIKTTPGEGFYRLDTVSNVTLTEELGIITESKIVPATTKKTK